MSLGRAVLIFGATGKQGGSAVRRLIEANTDFTILAVTRNASSASAKALTENSDKIKLVEGNLDDPKAVFEAAKKVTTAPIEAVFSVQAAIGPGAGKENEERQGKALIDEALSQGVRHFIYSSVDRGPNSDNNATNVPHFQSKYNIEKHLLAKTQNGALMSYTILRPVAFFDNLIPGFMGNAFAACWKWMGDKKLQMVAVEDIGWFAAEAFMNPEDSKYKNKAIGLAGDELNYEEGAKIFKEKTGYELPTSYWFVAKALFFAVTEMRTMFQWFMMDGYGVDIVALRKIHPEMQDFGTYIERSKYEKQK